jgi:predicted nucleic acid-binding Zn ribbon protein
MICLTCSQETSNPKFCSSSCAATYNNTGRRRHGKPPNNCKVCGNLTGSSAQIYCSKTCSGVSRIVTEEQRRATNAFRQSRYRAKKYRLIDPTADKQKMKEIYRNCPPGHEVDHIIPLSKGGKHHEDNLQYLIAIENRRKGNKILVDGAGYDPTSGPL